MYAKSILLMVLMSSVSAVTAAELPTLGAYGFNWSKPKTAKCQKVSPDLLKQFKTCRSNKERSGFGEHKPTHVCQAAAGEWILYAGKAQCQDELETMRANAP